MKRQLPLHQKVQKADYVIYNNGSFEDLQKEVKKIINKTLTTGETLRCKKKT